jgi:hypothetical protein
VRTIWKYIVAADSRVASNMSGVAQRVQRLAMTHWPDAKNTVFPLSLVVELCESHAFDSAAAAGRGVELGDDWLVRALRSGGVAFDSICAVYDELLDENSRRASQRVAPVLASSIGQIGLLHTQIALMRSWAEFVYQHGRSHVQRHDLSQGSRAMATLSDRRAWEAFGVDRLLDKYIATVESMELAHQGDAHALEQELRLLRSEFF